LYFSGPALFWLQLRLEYLELPWYMPILLTAGVVLMALSAWQRGGVWRPVLVIPAGLLCGLLWFQMLLSRQEPPYTGPAQAGAKMVPFTTTLADGREFTQDDLAKGRPTVLLFFRGRW
jgi:hypothetical protein